MHPSVSDHQMRHRLQVRCVAVAGIREISEFADTIVLPEQLELDQHPTKQKVSHAYTRHRKTAHHRHRNPFQMCERMSIGVVQVVYNSSIGSQTELKTETIKLAFECAPSRTS